MLIINVDGVECVMGTRIPIKEVLELWDEKKTVMDIQKYIESKGVVVTIETIKGVIREATMN